MQPVHTVAVPTGFTLANQDRIHIGQLSGNANAAGSGAGAAVTTNLTGMDLPASYTVMVNPGQDATWYVTNKTTSGFSVTLTPRLAANTLAAGTFDVVIVG